MRVPRAVVAGCAVAAALALSVAGCGGKTSTTSGSATSKSGSATAATSSPAPAPSPPAQPGDYTGLLIKATDIDAPIQFTAGPPTKDPNGRPGAAVTFSTEGDTHLIKDTVAVLADPAAATDALNAAKANPGDGVKNPVTHPFDVGTGGTTVAGKLPDGSKSVLKLMFTEGRAFVTLEFDGPVESLPPEDFVRDVGNKQDAAVKKGLGG